MTIDEILTELPQLSREELQAVIERIYELKKEVAFASTAKSISEKQTAQVEAMLAGNSHSAIHSVSP